MAKTNPFRFSTKYQDDETGLVYYGFRYYDQITGRWVSRDPVAEKGGQNLYVPMVNDPPSLTDSLGMDPLPIEPKCKAGDIFLRALNALFQVLTGDGEEFPENITLPGPPDTPTGRLPRPIRNVGPTRNVKVCKPVRGIRGSAGFRCDTVPSMMNVIAADMKCQIDWTDWRLPVRSATCSQVTPQPPGCCNWKCICPDGYNIEWSEGRETEIYINK